MKKVFLLFVLIISIMTTGCDNHEVKQKVIIGLDDEYAPMGFRNEQGEIVGFDVDMAKEAFQRLNMEIEFRPIDWDNKREEITSGRVDVLWNGTDITDERKEYMIFSRPYMDNRQILLVKAGNRQGITSPKDLTGKIVGTQAGSSSRNYVDDHPEFKNSFAEFKTYLNFKEAFIDLRAGNVDVLICDELAGRYELSKVPAKFEVIEVTVGPVTPIGIGFRKSDTELRDKVQRVFNDMIKDGTAKKISEKWFQADLVK